MIEIQKSGNSVRHMGCHGAYHLDWIELDWPSEVLIGLESERPGWPRGC